MNPNTISKMAFERPIISGALLTTSSRPIQEKYFMSKIQRTCIILGVGLWIAFYFIDSSFQNVVSEAVQRKEGLYGEMYGPLSYFRSLCLHSALIATIVEFTLSWKDSASKSSTRRSRQPE